MVALLSVPPSVALVVFSKGAPPLTTTVCDAAPGLIVKFTDASCATCNWIPERSIVAKPFADTLIEYVLGVSSGAMYAPDWLVTRVRLVPRCVSVITTVAFGTRAPLVSVTTPRMLAL